MKNNIDTIKENIIYEPYNSLEEQALEEQKLKESIEEEYKSIEDEQKIIEELIIKESRETMEHFIK